MRDELSSADRGSAQIGVVNPGGLRSELFYAPDGVVTYAEANGVLPFVNNLWTLSLTSAQFKAVLEQTWQPDGSSRPFFNLGLSDNVTYTLDPTAPRGSHITSINVNGAPIDPAASYKIGTFSFLGTGGDNFTAFTGATNVKDTGLVDRDAWIHYLQNHNPISPSFARRGVVASALPGAVTAGDTVAFTLSKLDMTSLGSPANVAVEAMIGGASVGSFGVSGGSAAISVQIPESLSGAQTLTLVASPSNTTVAIPLTVAPKPPRKGTVTLNPASVVQGGNFAVQLAAWDANKALTVTLDGASVGSVTTDSAGAAMLTISIAANATPGAHTVQARPAMAQPSRRN